LPKYKFISTKSFAITGYNSTYRYGKPFNPILGETFEYVDEETGLKYLAEQVSHHPPIAACKGFCGDKFVFWQETNVKTKFNGNSVDLHTQGKTHVLFPKTGDHFSYTNPPTCVHNLIIGSVWIDHFGELDIKNLKNNDSLVLTFEQCGWLGKRRYEVHGDVKTEQGLVTHSISGKWLGEVTLTYKGDNLRKSPGTSEVVWKTPVPNHFGKFKLTEFAIKYNIFDDDYKKILPGTDSRLRLDRWMLDKNQYGEAATHKQKLEEKQRNDRKLRDTNHTQWKPRFFKNSLDDNKFSEWTYCGDYWEQREKKIELIKKTE